MHRLARSTLAAGLLLALGATAGCSTHYIINTDVEDNARNRRIIGFCEGYRKAVEKKDVSTLLKLASPSYFEDGGNIDPTDDLDYAGLKEYLTTRFQDANGIRYEIRYHRVTPDKDRILVDYTYSASYHIPGLKGDEWKRKVEDNRLELVPFQDDFRIVAGM